MLVARSIPILFSTPIKPSFEKYYTTKTNLPFSSNQPKLNTLSKKNNKKYASFTFWCHLPTVELKSTTPENTNKGIGILEYFQGKNIFVTGATGLLGKVIVEKMLRSTDVGKVYLLIKADDKEAAFDRLNNEIICSELFTTLKEKYGKDFGGFVKEKLIPIAGDICKPNLGMDKEFIDAVRKGVHVIIHSAASTTLDERYDLLVDVNVIAPQRVMRFAKTCNKIQLFTQISTAYVNGEKEEIIMEKPLIMGGDDAAVDVGDEISLILKSSPKYDDATIFYRKLGQQRAEVFGWITQYQLSKAMGEMALNEIRGDIPLLIIRPSIVESCYNQPIPGWIQGIRMCDPVIISYGKGLLPGFFANPQAPLDIIPVDLIANATIAAIAKHGNIDTPQPIVYHVTSSHLNPLTAFDFFEFLYGYFKTSPLVEGAKIERIKYFDNFKEFSEFTREEIRRICEVGEDRKRIKRCNAIAGYAEQLCKMYEFIAFFKSRFHAGNTQKLFEEMSKEEQLKFEVDIRSIDWKKYFQEIHIPGLLKYVINSS